MVKKFMTIVLAAMLAVNLCACSNNAGSDTTEATTATNTSEISTEVPSEEDTKASTEVTAETTNTSSEDASTTEADAAGSKAEVTTEATTEKAIEKATEAPRATTEAATEAKTEAPKATTEAATEAKTEAPKTTTEASCSHPKSARVAKYKTVHHDAEYKTEKVWVEERVEITVCNTCGKEIKGTEREHDIASGTTEINIGTDEEPVMIDAWNCNGSHGEFVDRGHYEKQKVKVKDAYDEKVVDYYYCGNCGKRL